MPLQKQFRGVSDFIGRYRGGQLTFDLNSLITPTFDVTQFMEPPKTAIVQHSIGTAGQFFAPFAAPVGVPNDELWLVHALSAVSINPISAGQQARMAPIANLPSQVERITFGDFPTNSFSTLGSGGLGCWGVTLPQPYLLEPGWEPGFLVTWFTGGGSHNVQVGMRYQIIKI